MKVDITLYFYIYLVLLVFLYSLSQPYLRRNFLLKFYKSVSGDVCMFLLFVGLQSNICKAVLTIGPNSLVLCPSVVISVMWGTESLT